MCIIIDANLFSAYINKTEDLAPVREWVENKGGKIAYSPTPELKEELKRNLAMKKYINDRIRGPRIKVFGKDEVLRKHAELGKIKSDDPHVLALALAGKVKLLVSGDEDLHEDFKALTKGAVYQYKKRHRHLLTPDLCP